MMLAPPFADWLHARELIDRLLGEFETCHTEKCGMMV
jgi:hypothetical protein